MDQLAIQNSNMQLFESETFGKIRTILLNNEPWFIAADICKILDISNPTMAMQQLENFEKAKLNLGLQGGDTNIINESGFYTLVLRSRKPIAKPFRIWVTSEVLPSIRRTGSYSVRQSGQMEKLLAEITEIKDSIKEIRRVTTDNYYAIDEQLTNLLDNTESNNEFISEHNEKLETAIDNMTLSTRQQEKIHEAARVRINYLLGGAHSDQYKKSCRIYFINLWNSLKAKFHCGSSWKDLNPCDFENAVNYIGQWEYQG